jgi:glucose/arabinose dehydrogenase
MKFHSVKFFFGIAIGLLLASGSVAKNIRPANPEKDSGKVAKEEAWKDSRWNQTDVGQFLSSILRAPNGTITKGISIKVGEHNEGAVCYDTGLVNLRAAWTGKFLEFDPARFGIINGPKIGGELQFLAPAKTGWHNAKPVYRGLFLNGKRLVLSYLVDDAKILESPWHEQNIFTRTFELGASKQLQKLTVAEKNGSRASLTDINGIQIAVLEKDGKILAAATLGDSKPVLSFENESVVLEFPARNKTRSCKLFIAEIPESEINRFAALVKKSSAPENLQRLATAGQPRWREKIFTKGQVAFPTEPYVIDTITVPYDNPYKALMFFSGVDFFKNGDAAICTIHGDVWVVSGINDKLEKISWKRFATGLFQPLGLKIVNNEVHVIGRDQITILHDANHDGEADFYENFFNQITTSENGHDFVTCLETDSVGNFYYVDPSGVHRISKNGEKSETLATGFRNPNGMSVSPRGVITVTPQEGHWTPTSAICEVKPGGYYGFGGPQITTERPLGYDAPLCWIPRMIDNSSASQVWVTSDKWGPLKDQMLSLSFGRCSMMLVLRETVEGRAQGGVVPLRQRFLSGAMRGTFRENDGQLYVVGSLGWSTSATREGSFQRVRYTGKKIYLPTGLNIFADGIRLSFSESLDRATAEDVGSYGVEQWNYRYSKDYGSKEYSVRLPDEVGHDAVDLKSARLSSDGHSVFLEIPNLQPVMQMQIKYNVNSAEGKTLRGEIFNTINQLGKAMGSDSKQSIIR